MLVLSRRIGERIYVNGPCTIMPVRISENSVRIGIEAGRGVEIVREELVDEETANERNQTKEGRCDESV